MEQLNDKNRLSMEEILRDALKREVKYSVQYADYDLDTWTFPSTLSNNRIEMMLTDGSVRKIRLEFEM